jgi:hypothetical protein
MKSENREGILSLTSDPRWRFLVDEIKTIQAEIDTAIHNPATPHDMTQYNRGGWAMIQTILDIRDEALEASKTQE